MPPRGPACPMPHRTAGSTCRIRKRHGVQARQRLPHSRLSGASVDRKFSEQVRSAMAAVPAAAAAQRQRQPRGAINHQAAAGTEPPTPLSQALSERPLLLICAVLTRSPMRRVACAAQGRGRGAERTSLCLKIRISGGKRVAELYRGRGWGGVGGGDGEGHSVESHGRGSDDASGQAFTCRAPCRWDQMGHTAGGKAQGAGVKGKGGSSGLQSRVLLSRAAAAAVTARRFCRGTRGAEGA